MSKSSPEKGTKQKFACTHEKKETSRVIKAVHKNEGQQNALKTIDCNTVTFIRGVPGTGKTFVAVSYAMQMLMRGNFERVIVTRPVVEAGEHLGYLPGNYDEKIGPYLIPIMDILSEHFSSQDIANLLDEKKLVILPLAYTRGVTFRNAIVILDEAQNATVKQLHMFLTRIGEGSKVILTGDPCQSDIHNSGFDDAISRLRGIERLGICELDASCVVRDPIVAEIDKRYTVNKDK